MYKNKRKKTTKKTTKIGLPMFCRNYERSKNNRKNRKSIKWEQNTTKSKNQGYKIGLYF